MSMNQEHNLQLEFLRSVYTATENGQFSWSIVESSESDLFRGMKDGRSLDFEILHLQPIGTEGTIRAAILVSGFKTYFHVFAGTEGFNIIMATLSLQIPGWGDGMLGAIDTLEKAIRAVRDQ